MAQIKKKLARKAVSSTAKHTAHGVASKLKREPFRAATLFSVAALVGIFAGWLLGRTTSEPTASAATAS
ncbi:MAG: hypothetical protein U0R26_05625 [Solirubrobacterales bacterium]